MDPESMEVPSSAESGNASIETEPTVAPSTETTEPVAPTVETTETTTPPVAPTEAELFELPDGRKVDAVTLSKEWKENFYPDYTRKSQALAAKDNPATTTTTPTEPVADEWVPQTWSEVLQKAKDEMKQDAIREQQAAEAAQRSVEEAVISQLTEVKAKDPNINENALFQHAIKYGFRDLRTAHQNMQDMSALAKNVQQTTVKNVQKRADPVSGVPSAQGGTLNPSHFKSATDYLRAIKE